jgi:DNA polymerase sigma
VLVLKQYLHERGLNESYTGGLASYSLVLLVASFLQKYGRVFQQHVPLPAGHQDANLGALLLGFLELYGKRFDFDEMGISIFDGGYVEQHHVNHSVRYIRYHTYWQAIDNRCLHAATTLDDAIGTFATAQRHY